jgi:hypothetical protein
MSNAIFIPFNYEPVSTTVETTTYNLAAGQYAKITPIEFSSNLVIDGEIVQPQLVFNTEVTTTSSTFTSAFTNTTPYQLIGHWKMRVNSSVGESKVDTATGLPNTFGAYGRQLSSSLFSASSTTYQTDGTNYVTDLRRLGTGDSLQFRNNASQTTYVTYTFSPEHLPNVSFWASGGGSGITITGDKFTVELYDSIS